jgi:alkylation response protein AidB-like acyl-CoA dehydrogenase
MRSPGIEVRPIPTMVGESDFSEVFYEDVRIPLSNVVGSIDDGWRVAMSTLGFERGTAFIAQQMKLARTVEQLIELARGPRPGGGRPAIEDQGLARRLATARAEVTGLRAMTYTAISRGIRSPVPGPEGSMTKLFYSELAQRVQKLALDVLGPHKLERSDGSADAPDWASGYLGSFASTIGGGTSEIQRNIIGDRFLGLPRDRR